MKGLRMAYLGHFIRCQEGQSAHGNGENGRHWPAAKEARDVKEAPIPSKADHHIHDTRKLFLKCGVVCVDGQALSARIFLLKDCVPRVRLHEHSRIIAKVLACNASEPLTYTSCLQ